LPVLSLPKHRFSTTALSKRKKKKPNEGIGITGYASKFNPPHIFISHPNITSSNKMLNKNDNFKLREIIGIENIEYVGMTRIRKMMNVP
jgi:hypothetical protein